MRDSSLSWQKKLAAGFSCAAELLEFLELPIPLGSALAEQQFTSRIPLGFAQRMQKANPNDPLLLQVLATQHELQPMEGYTPNPLNENEFNPLKGLLHKYHGRVLVTLTGACAVNCRYCFRRHFPYSDNNPGRDGLNDILDYIRQQPSIHEVILSGGDPLLASNTVLEMFIHGLEAIKHVQTLRIHSRIPVVLPGRIERGLLDILTMTRLQKVIVLHSNHAQELDATVANACRNLKDAGCYLLNQTVLLKNINDNASTLAQLSFGLFQIGVLPYYLHLLDKVQGAAHFDIPKSSSLEIYAELQKLLPGYLVPRLVCETPGQAHKSLVAGHSE